MAQISRPQGGLRVTYPDSGAYTAVEWAERIAPFHSGDDFDESGVIPNNANYLNCTDDTADITIDTGICCVHGHVLINDAPVTISPTHPGAPDTYTVVAVQNNTAAAYNINLDTPAPYAAGIPAYSARLAILQDTVLVQNASYWMIPLETFDISAAGVVSNPTDAREWCDTRDMIDSTDDTGIADAHQIGTHAVTDTGGDTGLGVAIRAWLANASNTFFSVGRLIFRWSVATAGTERSRFELQTKYQGNEITSGVVEAPQFASVAGNARGNGAVDWQGYRANATEIASGAYTVIGGGRANTASGNEATIGGGNTNTATSTYTTVGGGQTNDATATHATVGGGFSGAASGDYSTIAGGSGNDAGGDYAFVGGGTTNDADGDYSTVGGGSGNDADGDYSAVGGGSGNDATANYTTVGGGANNATSADYAVIPGGFRAVANKYGQVAHASGLFGAVGDAQGTIQMVARCTTAGGGAATTLYLDGAAQRITISASSAWTYDILIVGMRQNAAAVASFRAYGVIYRDNANNTTLASTTGVVVEQAGGCGATVTADDANEALHIQVTDDSAAAWRFVATVRMAEVAYP